MFHYRGKPWSCQSYFRVPKAVLKFHSAHRAIYLIILLFTGLVNENVPAGWYAGWYGRWG
ncbi:hypothetical protein CLOBOL_03940 [Enterocloster bolteae ATCC BAA-613]|uniref:Uncharacterized protein n=1 Tax=Enterocloster bolteae (strain ATCC BAA-613 / DSM 15670 / CCUG 46953 / JCM 12243 / WAL 16351) TaxID=411902 RepID=A8RU93_ENTBW|nr:hypothetical protein CLOBOL_03940 [Enterocloster bolteae ATCC BAA-613]